MTQEELLRVRDQFRKAAIQGKVYDEAHSDPDLALGTIKQQAKALQDDPESLANQARLLVGEAERRGYQNGIQAGRLQLMSEMITNPNRN